jgi:EmrB/QacA subfamily drug resistance transporter
MADETTKKSVLFVATLSGFLTPLMASSINVALPAIQKDFGVDAILLTWIPTSYLLSTSMFLVPLGKLADILGRRKIFVYGISIFTFASCLSAAALNLAMLLAARVVQGIGTAMIFGTGMAMLATAFPPGERGKAIGINVTAVYIGLSVGPLIGGILTQYFSWRGVFAATIPLGILTIYVSLAKLTWAWRRPPSERFDITGSVLYALSIMVLMLGLSAVPSARGIVAILAGTILFIFFVGWQLKVPSPVINLELFRSNRAFAFSSAAALINYSATFAVTFLLSLYLQYIKNLDPTHAGLVLMAQPITMALFSPLAGRLSDRIEPQKVASSGMAMTALGLGFMTFLGEHSSIMSVVLNLILLGLGFALFSSPNMNAIMNSVERSSYGLAGGVVGSMRLLGQMLSMGIASVMFALYIGPMTISPELHPVFLNCINASFGVFGCTCAVGILASLARGKIIR